MHASKGNDETTIRKSVFRHSLNCLYTNARSLVNKIYELEEVVQMERIDLIVITETWGTDTTVLHLNV